MRRLIVCADDFGMNHAVDGGILQLADMGRLSAASCMSLGPSFAANATALRQYPVDMGLHLDLTDGFGVLPGLPLPMLIGRACAGLLGAAWVEARIERQLDAFERVCDRAPAYVDGHQHVHQLPGVLPRLLAALNQRYGKNRPGLRCTLPASGQGMDWRDTFKAHIIGMLGGQALQKTARAQGWRCNRHLLGVYGLRGGAAHYAGLLRRWLAVADDGDLLMFHPAIPSAGDEDPLQRQRAAELEVWSQPVLADWLAARHLEIARFSSVLAI